MKGRWAPLRLGIMAMAFFAAGLTALAPSAFALEGASANGSGIAETWENTLFQGKKVGFSFMRVERSEKGYQVTARAVLKLAIMGTAQDMSFSSGAALDGGGRLLAFNYTQTMQAQRQSMKAEVKDGFVRMTITGAGGVNQASVKAPPGLTLAHLAEYFFHQNLAEGKELVYPVFVESMRAVANLKLKVTGRKKVKSRGGEEEAFEVESEMLGMKTVTYVGKGGRKISGSSLMGISFEETTGEDAVKLAGADVPITSLITFSLITPDKPVENQEKLSLLKVTIRGISSPEILTDERQSIGQAIRIFDEKGGRTFSLPVTVLRVEPAGPFALAQAGKAAPEELKPTPEIQSDNKLIIKTAKEIVGAEADAWEAAKKINQWVHANLKKEFVDSFTAVDVLLAKKGECQSHTNLFVALARAVGLPAKVAGGIVYSKSNQGFLYHAWPEVYAGKWIALDPTMGQETADPTHIKLIEGGVESLMNLMRYITKISITVDGME